MMYLVLSQHSELGEVAIDREGHVCDPKTVEPMTLSEAQQIRDEMLREFRYGRITKVKQ